MRLRLTVILCAAGALACGGGQTPADSGAPDRPGNPGGGAGGDDTQGGDDTAAADDTSGEGWGSACPRFSGMTEGARWQWRYTDAYAAEVGQDARWSNEVTRVDGNTAVLAYEGEIFADSFEDYTYSGETRYRCDDGLWALRSETRTEYRINGTDYWSEAANDYGSGWLVLPANPAPGETWSVDVEGTSTVETSQSDKSSQSFSWSWDYRIEDGGTVDTPAGTFDATLMISSTNENGTSSWYADKHAGTVVQAGDYAELVSWSE